jgi:hypothetical protein
MISPFRIVIDLFALLLHNDFLEWTHVCYKSVDFNLINY